MSLCFLCHNIFNARWLGSWLCGVTFPLHRMLCITLILLIGELPVHWGEKWIPSVRAVRNFFFHYIALLSFYLQELCSFCTLLSSVYHMSHFLIPWFELLWCCKDFGRISQPCVCCSEDFVPQHRISAVIRRERSQEQSNYNIVIWSFLFWYGTPFWCPPDTKCEQQSFAPFSPSFKNVTHKNLSYK